MKNFDELERLRWELRQRCADIIMAGGEGDVDSNMSSIDALMVLYERHLNVAPETADDPDRDRFVLSRGSAIAAYYAILCERGFLDYDDVRSGFLQFDSPFVGQPSRALPGIETCTGALGHGLAVAMGIALAAKMDGRPYRTYVLIGEDELPTGSVWEAAARADSLALDNLCAIVVASPSPGHSPGLPPDDEDRLTVRLEGHAEERWSALGWNVIAADGHDLLDLDRALSQAARATGRPTAIVARTVRGYGAAPTRGGIACRCELPRDGGARGRPRRVNEGEPRKKGARNA